MKKTLVTLLLLLASLFTLWQSNFFLGTSQTSAATDTQKAVQETPAETQIATFAGGCFWGIEAAFQKYDGVIEAISGYTGGHTKNPTYEEVCSGTTGHLEAVQVTYDPNKISYEDLLEIYWRQINPTDAGGAFVDRGEQYTSAIFYHNSEQKEQALNSKQNLEASGKYSNPIVTKVVEATKFYAAEDYHQDYYDNNPLRAAMVCNNPVKKDFLKKAWGDKMEYKVKPPTLESAESEKVSCDDIEAAKLNLTPLQYRVTQEEGTEMPFHNEYWDNKEEGLYVDVVSGKVLFSSKDKFDSGTGWPSFTKPFDDGEIVAKPAIQGRISYSEIRSKTADSHLGHVFEDGPGPNGLRYCINSASLKFIPKDKLEDEGLGQFLVEFE